MGRKWEWFSSVRRAFIPYCCRGDLKDNLVSSKVSDSFNTTEVETTVVDSAHPSVAAPIQKANMIAKEEEESKHAYSMALTSAVALEAAAVAVQAATEVPRLATSASRHTGESRKEIAVLRIQNAYRRYKARKRLGSLRGLVRMKRVLDANTVKFQTTKSLQCMQTMARVQAQIHSQRVRMAEENQALQMHLQQKCENELEKFKIVEDWDSSLLSKEKIEENLLNKQEAAIKRERTLAYAYTHQWRNSTRSLTQALTDPSDPQWGWSWLGRSMAARPWDHQSTVIPATTKQPDTNFESTPAAAQKSARPPAAPRTSTPSTAIKEKSESLVGASFKKGSLSSSEK
ncbi:protein IQ-DOMAIN 3-like [Zingiber officinale]|uniref:protein IQ-DOMAIN 3-like n=1 Tax=Zingiber officinale TaxID=94328 RepID=UPI001C4C6E8D|nr:protein IQ-DOMAIN 3-like [Zingiber officinale]XP_042398655.1 protein IQ-DOMAIN 3-like [Zingiber officinale]XP_042398656.1 protein IQ-DOMAIN 3-like [Zingiber officinale]XP_042398657.1 protein IQ-DOMAIN 3-like [Zingiber officinale]XP_042398658.1 protein IQ-DOMAIN 3-like [Zingiber officinale]